MSIILYNYFRSSTSFRVRIALELKNLSYQYIPVHLLNNGGEQHGSSYRSLSPSGEVPCLVHNDKAIGQSFAIINYLDNVFPNPPLFSSDPHIKAITQQICENFNCMHPYQNLKTLQYLESHLKLNADDKQKWLTYWISKNLTETQALIEKHAKDFCVGSSVSAADLFLVPQMVSAERFQVDIKQFKTLFQIYENCLKVEAFQKAHPKNQPDFQK